MTGETDLNKLLSAMHPKLSEQDYVFCTLKGAKYGDFVELNPLASYVEQEGLTLVLLRENADKAKLTYQGVYKAITLSVHSSLSAVGLTAAVSTKLANRNISANVVAAYYHDHVFVQAEKAELAMEALVELTCINKETD